VNTIRTADQTSDLHDPKVDEKVVLSGLWMSMLFVFAYVDIFDFFRADVINGALAGTVASTGFEIDQTLLTLMTVYILIPSLMVVMSLLAPAKANRVANIIVSLLYAASIVVTVIGETWAYYVLGSVVEVVLLLAIARVAWTWQRRPVQ
jgi:ABC-type dipeptide/oligopeptide/nickel transport system permease subunit